jgi:hypothetical protein
LFSVVARLRSGVTLERARSEIETIRSRTAAAHPHPLHDQRRLRIVPLHDQVIGDARYALGVLLGAVIFVLLIACANAANLLLVRASARSKEIAIRVSVGAGRARVLRQLLVESAVLAALGSVAGLLFARAVVVAIQRINPQAVPRLAEAAIDGRGAQREPGVQAVSISSHGYLLTPVLDIEGEPRLTPEQIAGKPPIGINATTGAFARVMGLRMERGQWITDAKPVAVVNETLARREFRETDPIGRRIRLSDDGPLLTIVGVVADLKYSKLDAEPEAEVYVPYSQVGVFGFTVLARTTGDPTAVAPAMRRLVSEVDKTQVADDVMTLEQALAESIAPRRLNLFVLGTFAITAFMLALIGIYGVMAYVVTQGTHEIGVRMALGARPEDVIRLLVRQGMTVAFGGVTVGLIAAFALTRAMAGLLYDVEPTDPVTFVAVTTALATSALIACCVPALRAALVDPVTALRYE